VAGSLRLAAVAAHLSVAAVGWLGLVLTLLPLAVAVYRGFWYLGEL
jgi:hypothetical protein